MTTELLIVAGIVAAATAYLGWMSWRTIAGSRQGCGSGCGKCGTATPELETATKGRRALPQV